MKMFTWVPRFPLKAEGEMAEGKSEALRKIKVFLEENGYEVDYRPMENEHEFVVTWDN